MKRSSFGRTALLGLALVLLAFPVLLWAQPIRSPIKDPVIIVPANSDVATVRAQAASTRELIRLLAERADFEVINLDRLPDTPIDAEFVDQPVEGIVATVLKRASIDYLISSRSDRAIPRLVIIAGPAKAEPAAAVAESRPATAVRPQTAPPTGTQNATAPPPRPAEPADDRSSRSGEALDETSAVGGPPMAGVGGQAPGMIIAPPLGIARGQIENSQPLPHAVQPVRLEEVVMPVTGPVVPPIPTATAALPNPVQPSNATQVQSPISMGAARPGVSTATAIAAPVAGAPAIGVPPGGVGVGGPQQTFTIAGPVPMTGPPPGTPPQVGTPTPPTTSGTPPVIR